MTTLTKIVIVTTAVALILYDVAARLRWGIKSTISSIIQHAATEFPIIPLAFGILMGHFFWQSGDLRAA